ncbi:MAG: metallophosphoesterase [Pseudomonadota bacterium]
MSARRRVSPRTLLVPLLAALACSSSQPAWTQAAQVQWSGIDRVIAFADVHGAYPELLALLRESGVVDAQDRWAAGRTHVVSLGDLLDRGAGSRQVMDLLIRLQGEAQAAGGQLHVLLGNHEVMNLLGDLRYIAASEYASYADLESATERDQQRSAWQEQCGASCPPFEQKFPPGYFGKLAAFAPGGKYGQWLLSLPVAITLNETLFMHAGPANSLRGLTLPELNTRYRTVLADYLGSVTRLEQTKLLRPGDDYEARPKLARERLAALGGTPDTGLSDTIQRLDTLMNGALLGDTAPNWYRGTALCNEATETDVLTPLLQQFGATRLVIGHTPTRNLRAVTRFDGRVVKLDTGMNRAVYKGRAAALIIQPSGLTVRYSGQPEVLAPQPEGLFVAPNQIDDASVLAALRDGEITVTGPRGPNELNVTVSQGGSRIPAVFAARSTSAARKEVTAWRLDRLLQLGVVPATVEREVQGQRGVLQARPVKWVTQAQVQRQQAPRGGGWCDAEAQFQLLYAFDTLTGNEGRTPESLLFDANEWYVYGTSFEKAFGTTRGLPAYLKAQPPKPGEELRRRLGTLDDAALRTSLGEALDARERSALLARRDILLALPAAAAQKAR